MSRRANPAAHFDPDDDEEPDKDAIERHEAAWLNAEPGQGKLDFTNDPNQPVLGPQAEAASEAGKAEGIERVTGNNAAWHASGIAAIGRLHSERAEATGEDITLILTDRVGEPRHPNAWGALIAHAQARGLLVKTGERRPMRKPRSHHRLTDVYRLIAFPRHGAALSEQA